MIDSQKVQNALRGTTPRDKMLAENYEKERSRGLKAREAALAAKQQKVKERAERRANEIREQQAKRRLEKAAPELLAVVKQLVEASYEYPLFYDMGEHVDLEIVPLAEKAIAAAEGEQTE